MFEFNHPPIESQHVFPISPQRQFAEEAMQAIDFFGFYEQQDFELGVGSVPVSEHCDLVDDTGQRYALKLKGSLVFNYHATNKNHVLRYDEKYSVIELQLGILEEECEEPQEEDYVWNDYVVAIIKNGDNNKAWVLDKETGEDLNEMQLSDATFNLRKLNQQLRHDFYSEDELYSLQEESSEPRGRVCAVKFGQTK